MKKYLVLEYRIRKLEKAILEDIDSDLDKMSDDILNRMPNDDLDAELDKNAKDIVNKDDTFNSVNKYGEKYEFDTVNDWLDSIVFNLDLSNDDTVKVLKNRLKDVSLNFVGGPVWFNEVNRLRNYIKEISNASLPIAQQKLVNALRKRIKDIKNKKQPESLSYEGKT